MNTSNQQSKPVHSCQDGIHPKLQACVEKHREHSWRTPIHPGSQAAFEEIKTWLKPDQPLILDSGCGTGHSTMAWAERFPHAQVLGVDQSLSRLSKAPQLVSKVKLVRARAEDIWRLLNQAEYSVQRHYLMYPNPWPKAAHLQRRWHGHPAFSSLIRLGGELELRCNWPIYAQEFKIALEMYGIQTAPVVSFMPDQMQSLFERKYAQSGHKLYRLTATISKPFTYINTENVDV